jgi:hypothetical protein
MAVWAVPGRATVAEGAVRLLTPDGTPIVLRAAGTEDLPIRWWLERPGQRRPCTSVSGLLRALRNALGAGEGVFSRAKVAPGPA